MNPIHHEHQLHVKTVDETPLDAKKYAKFITSVKRSRQKLQKWRELHVSGKTWEANSFIGGTEGLSLNLDMAKIDQDGDGNITMTEFNEFIDQSEKIIEKSQDLLLNSLVIGTLLMSFFFPLGLVNLETSDRSADFFSDDSIYSLSIIYRLLLSFVIILSIIIIALSLRLFIFFSFYINSVEGKFRFLAHNPMYPLAVIDDCLLNTAPFVLSFGACISVSPEVGLIYFIAASAYVVIKVFTIELHYGSMAKNILHDEIDDYLKVEKIII